MPLDQRMREGMDRLSESVDPDVGERYGVARIRARRLRRCERAVGALAALGVVVVSFLAGPAAWDAVRGGETSEPGIAPTTPFPIPPGSYQTRISRDDALSAGVESDQVEGFAGVYVFTFAADGSYIWERATPNPIIKGGGGGTAVHAGDRILFEDWLEAGSGEDVVVRVDLSSAGLSFSGVSATPAAAEPLARALLASHPWTPTG